MRKCLHHDGSGIFIFNPLRAAFHRGPLEIFFRLWMKGDVPATRTGSSSSPPTALQRLPCLIDNGWCSELQLQRTHTNKHTKHVVPTSSSSQHNVWLTCFPAALHTFCSVQHQHSYAMCLQRVFTNVRALIRNEAPACNVSDHLSSSLLIMSD